MLKYILMILGGVIFIAGYYFMQQNEGRGKTMMFYSLFTYAGPFRGKSSGSFL